MSQLPDAATLVTEWTWKTTAMKRMTLDVCRLALRCGMNGEFSALGLKGHGEQAHGGSGIAGSVFRSLADAGIIAPAGVFVDGVFMQRRVRNAGGNPIGLWRLHQPGLARALVQLHDPEPARVEQLNLFAIPMGAET